MERPSLKPTDAHFRLLVQGVRDYAVFFLDPQGYVASWNEGARRIKGWTADEIVGQHFSRFYLPEDSEKPAMELRVAEREGRFEDEGWRLRSDGSRFWANVIITAVRDETGALIGFSKHTRDLSERKRMEEELRAGEARFRMLIDSIKDYAIFMLDLEGRVMSWSEGGRRILGFDGDEIVGKHFTRFYTDEDLASGKPARELRTAAGAGRYEDEGWRVRKDASRFWAGVQVTTIRDAGGRLVGYAKVMRDLSERREREEIKFENLQLEEERRRAVAASRQKTEFLAHMSHELRTPLNSIIGFSQLLAEGAAGPLTDQQKDLASEVVEHGRHLLSLINDVLDLSKVEAGRLEPRKEAVDVDRLIRDVCAGQRLEARRKGLSVTVDVPHSLGLVQTDPRLLRQIVLNLVANAVRFTQRGSVDVRAREADGHVEIIVADTGPGIARDDQAKLFEQFSQLRRVAGGTGLGLALVKRFTEALGGTVAVQSETGRGATFIVRLPR